MANTVSLGGNDRFLEVRIKGVDETYRVPLQGSMKMRDALEVRRLDALPEGRERDDAFFDWFYGYFCRFVPEEALGDLSRDDFAALSDAWVSAGDAEGESLGDEGASPPSWMSTAGRSSTTS